jgi:hypothetical protein
MLAALKRHYTLFCSSAQQAFDSAPSFQPHVVLFDPNLTDGELLSRRLTDRVRVSEPTFIALRSGEARMECSAETQHSLDAPIAECELEHLLWQVGNEIEANLPLTRTSA